MPDQLQFPAPKTQLMVSMPGVERDGTQLARRTLEASLAQYGGKRFQSRVVQH